MSAQLSRLQALALDLVVDDYQLVATIESEVKLLLGNGVSRQQITAALEELRDLRLVHAFLYREAQNDYVRYRRPKLKAGVEVWWYATDEGRREIALD